MAEVRDGEVFIPGDDEHYDGTVIDMVPASYTHEDSKKAAVGIVNVVEGQGFGTYADCGIVHEE